MFWLNLPISLGMFVGLSFLQWFIFSLSKRDFKLFFKKKHLFELGLYFVLSIILLLLIFFLFKKTSFANMLWLYVSLYVFVKVIRPYELYLFLFKKEEIKLWDKKRIFGISFIAFLLIEVFAFNTKAYNRYDVTGYDSFITEDISSNGEISNEKIILSNKQYIILNNYSYHDNLYIHFNNTDINLYVNLYTKTGEEDYRFYKCYLIDPKYDDFSYMSVSGISNEITSLKIVFDIDNSRYLNDSYKPLLVVDKIELDSNFPLTISPVRIGLFSVVVLLILNAKKLFTYKEGEQPCSIKRLEKMVLLCGFIFILLFFIYALINHTMYFIKYDELYLGGTSSNNIYYQQFDAYVKGQLHLDVPVDPKLAELDNPYLPANRKGITYLWDHAFYNGKYYSYYGHSPIYLVMFPVYWLSGYVPSNQYLLQLGVIFSMFVFILAELEIIRLFVKNPKTSLVVLTIIASVFGSLLFTNNTYEYGGMVYRIPYAYANGFLFLTIYLFLKGYQNEKKRVIYMVFAAISLVFIVLSRPVQLLYLIPFLPLFIKMIIYGWDNKKKLAIDMVPAFVIVLTGAILICVMNYTRFGSILEFGEHYQLTVTDCTRNSLSWSGLAPTLHHYFVKSPELVKDSFILSYRSGSVSTDVHPYITSSVGILYAPITLCVVFVPFLFGKKESFSFKFFIASTPIFVFFLAWFSYCFAGVCPRYLLDFFPMASLLGGISALKLIEKYQKEIPGIIPGVSVIMLLSVVLTFQYHFLAFDGYKIGDAWGLYSILKSIFNQYNV